jgi:hypothetical protein
MFSLSAIHCPASSTVALKRLESLADNMNGYLSWVPSPQCRSWSGVQYHLGDFVFGDVWRCVDLFLMKFCMENITWVATKVICYLCLPVLSIECQRARSEIGHCFHVTVERFFFLTLDSHSCWKFSTFPLSLNTLTLHISEEFSQCYFKKIFSDNCQFLFQQQSSLVRFSIMCFFFYFRFSLFSQ